MKKIKKKNFGVKIEKNLKEKNCRAKIKLQNCSSIVCTTVRYNKFRQTQTRQQYNLAVTDTQ